MFRVTDPVVFAEAEQALISLMKVLQLGQTIDGGLTVQDKSELMKVQVIHINMAYVLVDYVENNSWRLKESP